MAKDAVLDWLLEGDPAIRRQLLGDLRGASPGPIRREQERNAREGWGARLLELQNSAGRAASTPRNGLPPRALRVLRWREAGSQ
ncbi:MAG TPA: hypothetical protein VIN93_07730 [Bryobacteraceae bacterium]